MDKYQTNNFLRTKQVDVPQSFLLEEKDVEAFLEGKNSNLHFPLVAKPHDDGCSVLVQKISNTAELRQHLQQYFATEKTVVLLEEYIEGMELTCGVIGNDEVTVLPPSYTVATGGVLSMEEKFLPGAGENQTPAPLSDKALQLVQDVVAKVYRLVRCQGYSRIDCFYQDETVSPTGSARVVILEINTLPALTPATCLFHQAAEVGVKPMELIDKIVELGFKAHAGTVVTAQQVATQRVAKQKPKIKLIKSTRSTKELS